jgi:hypothetical protein
MPEEWLSVLPSIVASVVTTLLTLLITSGIGRVSRKNDLKNKPLLFRRSGTDGLRVVNRSKKVVIDVNYYVQRPTHLPTDMPLHGSLGTILPTMENYIQGVKNDDVITVNWTELKGSKPSGYFNLEFRIKPDIEEWSPESQGGGYGGH